MFEVPPPANGPERYEGVTVVKLPDKLDEVRLLFRLMYDDPPCEAPFDMIDSALRISHKYDAKRFYAWGLRRLCTYPCTAELLKDHKERPNYSDPNFLIRLIDLTRLLDKRELDWQATFAYYALSIIDWNKHNQGTIFREVDPVVLNRVGSGRSNILARNVALMQRIQMHRCRAGTHLYTMERGARGKFQQVIRVLCEKDEADCQAKKEDVMNALIRHQHLDFGKVLVEYTSQVGSCSSVEGFLKESCDKFSTFLRADFGFPPV